jgi:predicted nicotinamide N-methyase
MITSLLIELFQWQAHQLLLYVPDPVIVQQQFFLEEEKDDQTPFPYWTKLWPSALSLTDFLLEQPSYIQGKEVLELAAGLGLPSMAVAKYAARVCCSDYMPEAVEVMEKTIALNHLSNVSAQVLDWNQLPVDIKADVLLLSDVNYEPAQFEPLHKVLRNFLTKGTTIILATPQRLMAKPFLEPLLPFCIYTEERLADQDKQITPITILVLQEEA